MGLSLSLSPSLPPSLPPSETALSPDARRRRSVRSGGREPCGVRLCACGCAAQCVCVCARARACARGSYAHKRTASFKAAELCITLNWVVVSRRYIKTNCKQFYSFNCTSTVAVCIALNWVVVSRARALEDRQCTAL